jgi:hypothetical protein
LQPPISQHAVAGQSIDLEVLAAGTPPLGYQWFKNGANLPGATASSLPFNKVQSPDAAGYSVVVSNGVGSATSATAILVVAQGPPWFIVQPSATSVDCGKNAVIQALADGLQPITYQWQFQGAPIAGATNASLVFTPVLPQNTGRYNVPGARFLGERSFHFAQWRQWQRYFGYRRWRTDHGPVVRE